ncbi:flagellar motor switch protein FliN [Erythrobacter sp. YT30]|uniref:flagellar motor switch protein FliN n=1 Tax=Erythrobacter sp. YT30 TaxID=1735012 RepID=UPI000AA6E525|nr:flagellar motor switch protein FliN [Erythrobacter sp. YT30]
MVSPALQRFGDVTVRLSVELGRTDMPLRDVLALGEGSVVPLNRLTDELLDVTANGKVIARGEVVAHDGRFALRIVSLAGDEEVSDPSVSSVPEAKPQSADEGPSDAPPADQQAPPA